MFALSKLINLALGTVIVGGSGGIITPIVLGINNWLLSEDISKWSFNIKELETTEQAINKKLTESKVKYSTALKWLEQLKNFNFQKIIDTFNSLFSTETKIEGKYIEMKKKLEELIQLIEREGQGAAEQLEVKKQLHLLDTYNTILDQLNVGLYNWDKTFQKIICAIDNKDEKNENCNPRSWLRPLLNLVSLKVPSQFDSQTQTNNYAGGALVVPERKLQENLSKRLKKS